MIRLIYLMMIIQFTFISCKEKEAKKKEPIRIAFMSDIHLQDIYASFSDTNYKGIKNPSTGKYNTIRTMDAQLNSTRLFNENYFSFLYALNDALEKKIKIVVFSGDSTDDGQPMNVKALRKILEKYSNNYGMKFLITTGNHDPVRPITRDAGKIDFLGKEGANQPIMSKKKIFEANGITPIITKEIKEWGYKEILNELSGFGYFPSKDYLFWRTPFSTYSYENYSLEKAYIASDLEKRMYAISPNLIVPDASYLVEPVEGLWLIAIDANVYIPKKDSSINSNAPSNYGGASVGYNNVLTHKKHLIEWVAQVVKEANKNDKTLIAFSHYPMIDFNDGSSKIKKTLFGENKMQLQRVPSEKIAKAFANAGLKVHFGGHMHINDTGIYKTEEGNTLINIQTPSLAAYPAAYKIMTLKSKNIFDIETISLDSIYQFKELFPLYKKEHEYLIQNRKSNIWNEEILNANTYKDFVTWHLKELVRLRFIPMDWTEILKKQLIGKSGKKILEQLIEKEDYYKIETMLEAQNITLNDLEDWDGNDLIFDFYRLHNADDLAIKDIGTERIIQYKGFLTIVSQLEFSKRNNELSSFAQIFLKQFDGLPSDNFRIDLKESSIKSLLSDQ